VQDPVPSRVEAALRDHPGVSAVRVRSSGDEVEALITPRPGYPSPAQVAQWSEKRLAGWQMLWERGYSMQEAPPDSAFNLLSWVSSFDCRPYPDEAMREWIDTGVARIRALRPRRLLELGCGAGLVAHRIASEVEHYLGTDFSATAVARLRAHAPANVEVREGAAHELDGIDGFDTAVINSVAQFFPDLAYLEQVIARVVDKLPDGGALFLGDIRSYRHLRAFHAAVRLAWADGSETREQLGAQVTGELQREAELHVDDRWFRALPGRMPRLASVEIQLKRGRARTEMSLFRYDVTLRVGPRPSLVEVARQRELPNQRLADTMALCGWLDGDEPEVSTVAELRKLLAARDFGDRIDPESIWQTDPHAIVDWAASGAIDRFDVLRVPTGVTAAPASFPPLVGRASTDPIRATWLRHVRPELEARLRELLGDDAARVRLVVDESA
jgi:SAM-dependent methyltransferase